MAKIKDSLKKLSFLGDFSAFLLPLVLVVIAGLLFVPTTLIQRKLRSQIDSLSINKGAKSIETLLRSAVSSKQWEVERDYQNLYQLDANGISLLAEQTSQRQLLSYAIFPGPNETSPQIYSRFGQEFRLVIDKMFDQLKARDCPTQVELEKQLKHPVNSTATASEETTQPNTDKIIIDDLCMKVAKDTNLYADRINLSGYKFWENYNYRGKNEAVTDCWYWQLASWIIEDVLQTAKAVNTGSDSVLASPLKRLMYVSFTPEQATSSKYSTMPMPEIGGLAIGGFASGRPRYVLDFKDSLVEPFTARICNDQIDIVHFRISVIVSTYAIPRFFEELCSAKEHKFTGFKDEFKDSPQTFKHNQITILSCNYAAVDSDSDGHKLYRYGDDSVVKMDLICEYAFVRKGYDQIKPKVVRETIDKALKKTAFSSPSFTSGVVL